MNEFGKVCVVFVTAASLAFVAFAGALRTGGRNWQREADELSSDFVLATNVGEKTTYALTHRRTNQPVGSPSSILAEVVTAARAKQAGEARDELKRLTDAAEALKAPTDAAVQAVKADEKGLAAREAALAAQVGEVNQAVADINTQIIEAADEAQKIRNTGQERREEVYALQNVLNLLRNDLFVAQLQRKSLEEEEVRLQEILARLERRQQQLSGRVDVDYESK